MSIDSMTLRGLLLGCLLLPVAAHAAEPGVEMRVVCCDVDGKLTCGDPPPPQCLSRAKTVIRKGGMTKKEEAPLTAEQLAARQAEQVRRKEEEKRAAEQGRKDRALLESYTSAKEIDAARDRLVADIEKNAELAKTRLAAAREKQAKLDQEKEFYRGGQPMPASLKTQLDENTAEMAVQQKALGQKDADIFAVRQRFAADRQRFLQLGGKP